MSNFKFLGDFLGKVSNFSKDGHDMSNNELDSLPFGVICPRKCQEVVPDETYKVNYYASIQTAPMREDNYTKLYSNLKAVYVPVSQIWRDYFSLTNNNRDTRKDLVYKYPNYFPVFDLADVLGIVVPMYAMSKGLQALMSYIPDSYSDYVYVDENADHDVCIFKGNPNIVGASEVLINSSDNNSLVNLPEDVVFGVLLVCGVYSIEGNFILGHKLHEYVSSFEKFKTLSGNLLCYDILRLLDSLGYGNQLPIVETIIYNYFQRQKESAYIDSIWKEDLKDDEFYVNADQYDVHFGFNSQAFATKLVHDGFINRKNVSLLPLLSFQYYVYSCEVSNYRKPLLTSFTWDSFLQHFYSISMTGFVTLSQTSVKLDFDMDFESISFSQSIMTFEGYLLSSPAGILEDSMMINIYLWSLRNPLLDSDLYTTMQDSVVYGSIPTINPSDFNSNAIQELADTKALYKLKQDLLRSGVRRDKQFEVLYGVKNDNDLFHQPYVLGMDSRKIDIVTLINQAETDVAPLGQRASRGNGVGGLHFKLDTKDFGYIFFVHYITTESIYENFGVKRSHVLSPIAWFNPRNNNLGLEGVDSSSLSLYSGVDATAFTPEDNFNIGFSARDWHLKQQVNLAHGLFSNFGFPVYAPGQSNAYHFPGSLIRGNSIFGGFVPTLIDQQSEFFQTVQSLYFNPYMVNNIFVQMVDGGIHGDFSYDQFRNYYTYQIHKVSPMPKLGLIKLN